MLWVEVRWRNLKCANLCQFGKSGEKEMVNMNDVDLLCCLCVDMNRKSERKLRIVE